MNRAGQPAEILPRILIPMLLAVVVLAIVVLSFMFIAGDRRGDWQTSVSACTRRDWKEHRSRYALREIVDTFLNRENLFCSDTLTRDAFLALLGPPDENVYPGIAGDLMVYEGSDKSGFHGTSLILGFDTNGLANIYDWYETSEHPFGAVRLPYAPHSPMICDISPMTVDITVDQYGRFFMHCVTFSGERLASYLKAKYKKYGEYPVRIAADKDTPFSAIEHLIVMCGQAGLWRMNYAVRKDIDSRYTTVLDFAAPVVKGDKSRKGPVLIDLDTDAADLLMVTIDGYSRTAAFKAQEYGGNEIEELLAKLPRVPDINEQLAVVAMISAETLHSEVVEFLDLCCRERIHNVSIVPSGKSSQEDGQISTSRNRSP